MKIREVLIIATLILPSISLAAPNIVKAPPDMQRDFEKLKAVAGPNVSHAKLYINTTMLEDNAVTWVDGSIVIWQGELNYNKNHYPQLLGIIAHEIAHVANGDLTTRVSECHGTEAGSRRCELEADLTGKRLLKEAGFDECAIGEYWKRALKDKGNLGGNTHPTHQQRYEATRCK